MPERKRVFFYDIFPYGLAQLEIDCLQMRTTLCILLVDIDICQETREVATAGFWAKPYLQLAHPTPQAVTMSGAYKHNSRSASQRRTSKKVKKT